MGKAKQLRKVRVMIAGFKVASRDSNVLYKLVLSLLLLTLAICFRSWVDASLIILATAVNVSVEMLNTAIEALCDFVHPEHHEEIGVVKDIAAAAVGAVSFAWIVVVAIELLEVISFLLRG